ncbi:hypothetical protein G6F35_019152 [Rhizopus arrhizus]|nr:hypothetical protein G6F35_019152 [Rhizopus arrhizus]
MVGNMMELNRPMLTTAHLARPPLAVTVMPSRIITATANRPSRWRASSRASSAAPTRRPASAPPQYSET